MGSLIEKHKSEEMKLISAIVAAATAQQMVQTDYWNGVDESNTCGSTWEWQDADGNGISVVNATCTWTSNSVITYAYADNGAFVAGSSAGDVRSFDFQGANQVTNLTTDFGVVSGSGNSWAVSVQNEPFGDLLQLTVEADVVPDLFATTVA